MDTFFATKKGGKSSRGNTCCQLFVTDKGFVHLVPMRKKSDVLNALKQFAKEIGAPEAIVCDAAGKQTSIELKRFLTSIGTTLRVLEQGTPWSNRAELYVGLIKAAVHKDMRDSKCPLVFWDYCAQRRVRINNLTSKDSFKLNGITPHEDIHAEKGDISNVCLFDFYEWCYAFNNKAAFPHDKQYLGRCLGPAFGTSNKMCQWVLLGNGQVVAHHTVCPLTVEEKNSPEEEVKRGVFDERIKQIHGSYSDSAVPHSGRKKSKDEEEEDPYYLSNAISSEEEEWEPYQDLTDMAKEIPLMEDAVGIHAGRYIH